MKDKQWKRVPFDIELAKKIQSGKVEGRMYFETKSPDGSITDIWDIKSIHDLRNEIDPYYVIAICAGQEYVQYMNTKGYISQQLVFVKIELPEETPLENRPTSKDFQEGFQRGYDACLDGISKKETPKQKFKVGDWVKVVKTKFDSMFDGCYLGKEFVIKEVKTTIAGDYTIGKEGWKDNNFPADCLELVEEAPKHEFKPFDKVLVLDRNGYWVPRLYEMYSGGTEKHYCQDGHGYNQILPYEGNEHLVGTTNNPE